MENDIQIWMYSVQSCLSPISCSSGSGDHVQLHMHQLSPPKLISIHS